MSLFPGNHNLFDFSIASLVYALSLSFSQIAQGWPRKEILERYNRTSILPAQLLFDAGVHIRNQLSHFESNSEREDSAVALSAAYDYMNSTKYGNLLKNIGAKLDQVIFR